MRLATKYRPTSFDTVAGQKVNCLILRKILLSERIPPGLLFCGPWGTGKTSLSRIFAACLNCTYTEREALDQACGYCPSCKDIFDGSSVDVLEIDAASHGSVAHVRELVDSLRYSVGARYRILILDEAQSMSKEAFHALLKTLEEPPERTVFILATTEPHKILTTILSRVLRFDFSIVGNQDIFDRLAHIVENENIKISEPLLRQIAFEAKGHVRDAVMKLDQVHLAGIENLEEFKEISNQQDFANAIVARMLDADLVGAMYLAQAQLERNSDVGLIINELVRTVRNMLVAQQLKASRSNVQGGVGSEPHTGTWPGDTDDETSVDVLAARAAPEALQRACRVVWELLTRIKTADARTGLDLALVLLTETLAEKKYLGVAGNANNGSVSRKNQNSDLSLEQLQRLASS